MTTTTDAPPFPRGPLVAIGGLIVATLVLVGMARLTGYRDDTGIAPSTAARELRFEDRAGGGVAIHDARTGQLVHLIAAGEDGFLRATMRSLARERLRVGANADLPFLLSGTGGGRVTLEDPATGRRLAIEAFGPTQAAAFTRFLDNHGAQR